MAGAPDLFVVCKNCQAEVSPYITECPYCGHRLRKRAPKLDKGGVPRQPKRSRRRPRPSAPSLGRLRPGEMPGVRGDGRPYVTIALVLGAVILTVLLKSAILGYAELVVAPGATEDWWQRATTVFSYESTGYEIAALGTVFLFGWLLERRHGHWAPLLVFALASAGGMALALGLEADPLVMGANAGALGLLGAWVVRDLLALRRRDEIGSDLLGVAAIAILLLLLPAAQEEAHPLAGLGGALTGLVLGLVLARLKER